jgi:hypothetical protein
MCSGSRASAAWRGRAIAALGLVLCAACDPSFDTSWREPSGPLDAGGDASDLDAEPPPSDGATAPDAPEFDGAFPPLRSVNCSAVVRDAGPNASCDIDCFAACLAFCTEGGADCADAEITLQCWQCQEGGVPPTL